MGHKGNRNVEKGCGEHPAADPGPEVTAAAACCALWNVMLPCWWVTQPNCAGFKLLLFIFLIT